VLFEPRLTSTVSLSNTISHLWKNYNRNLTETTVVALFLEIVVSAAIENVHYSSDPEVWVRCTGYFDYPSDYPRFPSSNFFDQLEMELSAFLRSEAVEPSRDYIRDITTLVVDLGIDSLAEKALRLLGLIVTQPRASDIVAFSSNGQVAYFTLLESLYADRHSLYAFTVLPGWLQYEGQRYPRISGAGPHYLGLEDSKVSADDFSDGQFEQRSPAENSSWMLSVDDDILQCYLLPYVGRTISMKIRSTMRAIERLWFYEECAQPCAKLSEYKSDLKYCRTVAAALDGASGSEWGRSLFAPQFAQP
jgi:hypothetical protein